MTECPFPSSTGAVAGEGVTLDLTGKICFSLCVTLSRWLHLSGSCFPCLRDTHSKICFSALSLLWDTTATPTQMIPHREK